MKPSAEPYESSLGPRPHRVAWVLACLTFPLICWGGTVTTYEAGMAVPDWPTTYGSWFYPLQKWLWIGVTDLFLEHGHRTLAQIVGLAAIWLAVMIWRRDGRRWMRWLASLLIVGVIFQGTLGGIRVIGGKLVEQLDWGGWLGSAMLRVIADDVLLRKIHGCTAPIFFGLCAAAVIGTSRRWLAEDHRKAGLGSEAEQAAATPQQQATGLSEQTARRLRRLAVGLTAGIYLLIVLGAQLRHLPMGGAVRWFELWVWLKVSLAALVAAGILWLWLVARRIHGRLAWGDEMEERLAVIHRRASRLAWIYFAQLGLGAGTWITNYNWPVWFKTYVASIEYTVVDKGMLQATVTTAHAAVGSLSLAAALSLSMWSYRLLRGARR